MDFSVDCLAKGLSAFRDKHPDFYTYPVMLAFEQFEKVAPKERLAAWRKQLAAIHPSKTYAAYGKADNNWTLVHTGGEFLRSLHGLTDLDYVERALKIQRTHMTPLGLYLEHGAPFAYDAFSRYFLTGMFESASRISFPMLVFNGQEETDVKLEGNTIRLQGSGRGVQVVISEPSTARWQRTGKRLSHRNGLVEEAFADAAGQRPASWVVRWQRLPTTP